MRGRPTREQAEALGERLLRAAVEQFLDRGFDAVTVQQIADAAHTTKRTVYARYANKDELFGAAMWWALSAARSDEEIDAAVVGDDLEAALLSIGRAAVARSVDPTMVQLFRIAMVESERIPELAATATSLSWSPRLRRVTEVLAPHIEAGAIEVDDVELAAESFLTLVAAMPARLASLGVYRSADAEERHLRHAVRLFVRAISTPDWTPPAK